MFSMINPLFNLPVVISATIFVAVVVLLSLGSYGLARRFFARHAVEETRDLAGSVLFRIAALHGLVLALVFAQELGSIRDVTVTTAHEAAMLGDIYYDLERYGGEEVAPIQTHLARYAAAVLEEEWDLLARERTLSSSAWEAWGLAYDRLLDLAPATPRQERLLAIMLADIRELSELREARENAAHAGASALFLVAAFAGIFLISAAYFTWPPTALNLSLLSGFAAYTGLIIFFVMAYANPYHAPGNAEPSGFERFLNDDVRARLGGSG